MSTSHLSRSTERPVTVAFRYDDYSSRTDPELDRRQGILQEFGIACTVGVVPCVTPIDESLEDQQRMPLTPEKVQWLRPAVESGLVEVALHGFDHKTILSRADGGWTEFAGLDLSIQMERIDKGKRMLEDWFRLPVNTFIPPWNSYDLCTLQALELLGFECISAGTRGMVGPSRLSFVPYTCGLFHLPEAVAVSRSDPSRRSVIIALYHPADLTEPDSEQKLRQLLRWVQDQKDVEIRTIQYIVNAGQALDASQYKRYFGSRMRRLWLRFTRRRLLFESLPA